MHSIQRLKLIIIGVLSAILILLITLLTIGYKDKVDTAKKLSSIRVAKIDPSVTTTKYNNYGNKYVQYEEFSTFDYSTFTEEYITYADETNIASDVSMPNVALYNLCDRYFTVDFGGIRMSPIVPMAMANVETPGRADHSITWSALFPSKVVPIELLETMDVTTVVSNSDYYKVLSNEVSTRDRGALQMSPTYGTGKTYFNDRMSGTERDKLNAVNASEYANWVSGASTEPGDRFHLPDVLLRLSSAFTSATEDMARNDYIPESDIQLYVMCSMYHHRSGVWTGKAKGGISWNSSDLAYEYSSVISSIEFLDIITEYCHDNPSIYTIDSSTAMELVAKVCDDPSKYCGSKLVLSYPVKCLYAYVKLSELYGG